jgi:hypothetical protein
MQSIIQAKPQIINSDEELLNIVNFLRLTWDLPESFSDIELFEFIKIPFEAGLKEGLNWCESSEFAIQWSQKIRSPRFDYLKNNHKEFMFNDGWLYTISTISDGLRNLNQASSQNFDYDSFRKPYLLNARSILKGKTFSPKLYGSLKNISYKEYRDNSDYHNVLDYWANDENGQSQATLENDLFKGFDIATLRSLNLVERLSLNNILQNHDNHGRDPIHELISGIIAHGMNVSENNNTAEAICIIDSIKISNDFQFKIPELPNNKFIKACFIAGKDFPFQEKTPEFEKELLEHIATQNALSDDQKKKQQEAQRIAMKKQTQDIFSELEEEDENPIILPKLSEIINQINSIAK